MRINIPIEQTRNFNFQFESKTKSYMGIFILLYFIYLVQL